MAFTHLALLLALATPPGIRYDVSVLLEPEKKQMSVESVVFLPAGTTSEDEIPISLGAQMGTPELILNDQPVEPIRTQEVEATLGKKIVRTLAIDSRRDNTVTARYTTVSSAGFVYRIAKTGSYASGSNTDWVPSTEGRVVASTITVNVPKGEVVKATGSLVRQEDRGDRTVFTYHCDATATLSFAAGPYHVVRDTTGRLPVALYLFEERPFAPKAVRVLREVADTLEQWFGPYPFGEMAIVEVDPASDFVAGFAGASLEGFLLAIPRYIDGDGTGPNLAFIGHELGHAWWGHQIKHRNNAPGRYMMDEALAQFGALKAVEAIEGGAKAKQFRRTGYPGFDPKQSGRGGLLMMLGGFDPPLARLEGQKGYHLSDRKGFQVYHQLEQVIGSDKLRSAFKTIQKESAWQRLDSKELISRIAQHAGTDLDWFYDQWFERSGAPRWTTRWHQEGDTLVVTVEQSHRELEELFRLGDTEEGFLPRSPEDPFRFTTKVEALMESGERKRWRVEVAGKQTELKLAVEGPVQAVFFDPDWDVFHWDLSLRSRGMPSGSWDLP